MAQRVDKVEQFESFRDAVCDANGWDDKLPSFRKCFELLTPAEATGARKLLAYIVECSASRTVMDAGGRRCRLVPEEVMDSAVRGLLYCKPGK